MTFYLDNNIIVSIENGDYTLEKIRNLIPDPKARFFYSSAHLFEAECFPGTPKLSKVDFLSKRINNIRKVFKKNYLYLELESNRLTHIMEDPQEVFDTITLVPFGLDMIRSFMNVTSNSQKDEYRNQLGVEIKEINNYQAEEVIEQLNKKLTANGSGQSFLEMIEYGIKLHQGGKTFGLHNRIAGVFELLDLIGYWKDKETETSNYARLWDADHCFFASYCDFFVSDDRRTRNKAAVVYNTYNQKTKIISSNG